MTDYSKGQIYKIVDTGLTKCYIGSSVQKLCKRMGSHRRDYKKYKTGEYHYCSVFDLFDEFGVENCKIVWIKNYPCNSKEELEAEEGRLQQENDCVNKNEAGRTTKQRNEDNKEIYSEKTRRNTKKIEKKSLNGKNKIIKNIEKQD